MSRPSISVSCGAPASGSEPRHGLRLFAIWIVLALAADLLIWFALKPHLPPGDMSDAARHQQFDIAVLAVSAAPVVVAVDPPAPASRTNTATVAGGGGVNPANDSGDDPTTVTPPQVGAPKVTIPAPGFTFANQTRAVSYTVTYTDDDLTAITLSAAS